MKIAVLGAGSFGTALSIVLAENSKSVSIWSHSQDIVLDIEKNHRNSIYLQDIPIPRHVHATADLEEALYEADYIVSVIPTQATREVWVKARPFVPQKAKVVVASKGIEINSHRLIGDILLETLGDELRERLYFLSGPSFAREVALKQPTAITISGFKTDGIPEIQNLFLTDFFRTYGTPDVTGVQLGGALKNVIAIAVGISDGLEMGNNSRAALITRGLAEIARLGRAMGAEPLTFMGLAGLGDLVLTCTGDLSRNRTAGIQIGKGLNFRELQKKSRMIAEGITTARSAYELSLTHSVEMPITEAVYRTLYEDQKPQEGIPLLMSRQTKFENQ